jgi:hypothetical protein
LLFLADLVGPLHPNDHRAFLQLLAAALRYEQEPIGDGILHREAREFCAVLSAAGVECAAAGGA